MLGIALVPASARKVHWVLALINTGTHQGKYQETVGHPGGLAVTLERC